MNITDAPSKKDQVRNYLLTELQSGKYPPGTMFLSENVIFRELGICKNTVREALSSLVSDGLLERVRGKGTFVLEPRPERNGNALGVVHFICANPWRTGEGDPFISGLLQGLHAALDPFQWRICMDFAEFNQHAVKDTEDILRNIHPGECAVLAGFNYSREITELYRNAGIRIVTIGQPEDESILYVDTDYFSGSYDAVSRLIANGHRSIALVDRRGPHFPSCEKRRRGYLKALADHGVIPDARLIAQYSGIELAEGEKIWDELNDYGIDFSAVLIYGDLPVLGFLKRAMAAGRNIPQDLSVIACCGTPLLIAERLVDRILPDLTELGSAAGNLIRQHPLPASPTADQILTPCRTIPGETVAQLSLSHTEFHIVKMENL